MLEGMGLVVLLGTGLALLWLGATCFLYFRLRHPVRLGRGWAAVREIPADPEALGLEGEEVTFTFRRGTSTKGWLIRGDRADGPMVLLTHGFGDCMINTLNLAPHYVPHASWVVVYDVAAHGSSTDGALTFAMREPYDVSEILEQLDESVTACGVVLAGCSMGGVISVRASLLARVRTRLRGVVLEGAYRLWWEPIDGMLRWCGYPSLALLGPVRLFQPWLWQAVGDIESVRDAGQIGVPVLVLHGDLDPVSPVESGEAIAEAAPRGRLVRFEKGHHLDLARLDPERYDAALTEFFTAIEDTDLGPGTLHRPHESESRG